MDEEVDAIRRKVLSELEKSGENGITWENLKARLPAYNELFCSYETVMLGLEEFGCIKNIEDKYSLTKKGRELFS